MEKFRNINEKLEDTNQFIGWINLMYDSGWEYIETISREITLTKHSDVCYYYKGLFKRI